VAVAAVITLSACSGGDSEADGPETFDAKAAASAVRAVGTIRVEGSANYPAAGGEEDAPIDGLVQYEPRRTVQHFPVAADSAFAKVEYRRIGDDAWLLADESTQVPRVGFPILVVRPEGYDRPWQLIDPHSTGVQGLVGKPFDPADLLDAAAARDIAFARDGEGKVRGDGRARYVATIENDDIGKIGVRELAVFTDDDGLPVRIEFTALSGAAGGYDITATDDQVVVEPPDPNRVELQGELPKRDGPYAEVATGTAGTVAFTVSRAPANADRWDCWKVESQPAYEAYEEPDEDGDLCLHGIIPDSKDPSDQVAIPLDASSDTPYELLGLLVPQGTNVVMHLAGGTEKPVPVDDNGLAIYAGPETPAAGLAVVTLPDSRVTYCAPGVLNNLADLAEIADDGGALRDQPWNCLEKELAEALGD
jgi:hypothetical protein